MSDTIVEHKCKWCRGILVRVNAQHEAAVCPHCDAPCPGALGGCQVCGGGLHFT